MNVIIIRCLSDLNDLINYPVVLSCDIEDEIGHNLWCIGIDQDYLECITAEGLMHFFNNFIDAQICRLKNANPELQATLYIWFDKQALQLRFNILSGVVTELPFQCHMRKVSSLQNIVDDFLKTIRYVAQHGDTIELDDNSHELEDNEEDFVLDIYAKILN